MSYRWSELAPQTSTSGMHIRMAVRAHWSAPPEKLRDMQFLRSWLEFDSQADGEQQGRVKWNALLGLTVMTGVSAGFWTGVGFLIARLMQ